MTMPLMELSTLDDFEAAVAGSTDRPLLLFKHSVTCGTSAYAREEVEEFLLGSALAVDARSVRVQTERAISNAIADRFGIRHESPQLFLVVEGRVVWHASHHRITRREIAAAVQRHCPVPRARP